jgi:N-acetylmuramoyl-L-alanine amidase
MPIQHTVEQGECLFTIAKKYGFEDWHSIYDDALNAEFRKIRPNPNIIYPGDVLNVPDKKSKTIGAPTGKTHYFEVNQQVCWLRILIKDEEGEPLANKKYRLSIDGDISQAVIPQTGLIQKQIPADAALGELEVWTEDETRAPDTWSLSLGHLDPIEMLSGIQARLNNLGYACGPVDGIDGPLTQHGVRAFQTGHSLKVDGIAGPKTQAALKKEYGC